MERHNPQPLGISGDARTTRYLAIRMPRFQRILPLRPLIPLLCCRDFRLMPAVL